MSTKILSRAISTGALVIQYVVSPKQHLMAFLPKLNGAFIRFNSSGSIVADDNPLPFSVVSSAVTAKSGDRFAVNTTASAVTITLPASPAAGDFVEVIDAAQTFHTNNLTLSRNSLKIDGASSNLVVSEKGARVTLVYINSTVGWRSVRSVSRDSSGAIAATSIYEGTARMGRRVAAPSANTDAGFPGDFAANATHLFIYTGDGSTHSWSRSAIAAW